MASKASPDGGSEAGRWVGGADAGATLIELVVTMSIMTIVGAVFTAGIADAYRSSNLGEARANGRQQLSLAFERLDRDVRYASAISRPGTVGGDWYVEFSTVAAGPPTCTELRLASSVRQLQRRTWTSGAGPAAAGWSVLASGVSAGHPFDLLDADDGHSVQRLRVVLDADVATGAAPHSDVTFGALNSSTATANATVCAQGRSSP